MSQVVMYASVSVDGFIAAEDDDPGPLFEWLVSGEVALDESGVLRVSQASYDHVRPYWDEIAVTIVGRHVFDITDGWDGTPPAGVDHVVVVSHRPPPEGWDSEAPFHFVDGIESAMATAHELAGDRAIEVAAGDLGGQMLAAGFVDQVRMDVVPVVFGSGEGFFAARSLRSTCWTIPMSSSGATGCCTSATPYAAHLPECRPPLPLDHLHLGC